MFSVRGQRLKLIRLGKQRRRPAIYLKNDTVVLAAVIVVAFFRGPEKLSLEWGNPPMESR